MSSAEPWCSGDGGRAFGIGHRFSLLVFVLLPSVLQAAVSSLTSPVNAEIMQDVRYVWPVTLWQLNPIAKKLTEPLADLAEKAYDRYVNEILPKELASDPDWAEEFENMDGSRTNIGFLRWQKRAFSKKFRVSIESLDWDGRRIPKLSKADSALDDLCESKSFVEIRGHIEKLGMKYARKVQKGNRGVTKVRAFVWAEVYKSAEYQHPHTHTGALVTGLVFARHATNSDLPSQKVILQDPRGEGDPFGQTFDLRIEPGGIAMWPSWVPHFTTPQPVPNATNVMIGFLVWPRDEELDWEDDATGDYIWRRSLALKRPKAQGKGGEKLHDEF